MEIKQRPIIFFDGICGLCNRFVDFIIAIDKNKRYVFCPLQSEFAQKTLPQEIVKDLDSVICMDNNKIYTKSTAVLIIMKNIGGIWKITQLAHIIPESLRNKIYDFIANNRYIFFGKKETCRLPTPEERARFVS